MAAVPVMAGRAPTAPDAATRGPPTMIVAVPVIAGALTVPDAATCGPATVMAAVPVMAPGPPATTGDQTAIRPP